MKISRNIPHINILRWETKCNDEKIVKKASEDKTLRNFGMRFFLEDLRARTQHAHVTLTEELSQSIDTEQGSLDMWFEKNKAGFLSSIFVDLKSISHKKAFQVANEKVVSILSMLTFLYCRPFRVSNIMVIDTKYKIEYFTGTYCSTPEKLVLPAVTLSKEAPFGSLLAIYREGMNSLDLAYRYISFFKIYEAWYKKDFAFKLTDNVMGERQRPDFTITPELLSGLYLPSDFKKFVNKSFYNEDVSHTLNYYRNILAHYMLDRVPHIKPHFISFDDIGALEYLEALSNLIERMATTILDAEFELLAECDENFKKLYEVYKPIITVD